jgi:hypothetical protein
VEAMAVLSKSQSHGRIGEAAVYAKCWMYGIPAYHTGGLRANFAGSDLIVETKDPRIKLWIQVKTGAPILRDHVYLTQCAGEEDLNKDKFAADFVVFVNIDLRTAKAHIHDGSLDFKSLSFYVVPCADANRLYQKGLKEWAVKPKRNGGRRKLGNMAVHVPSVEMAKYHDAWKLIHSVSTDEANSSGQTLAC